MMDQAERLRMLVRQKADVETPKAVSARPRKADSCKIIAFVSGKGGVGKTTLALNTAALVARSGKRVGIVDIGAELSSIGVTLGIPTSLDLSGILNKSSNLRDAAYLGPCGIQIVSTGIGGERLNELSELERMCLTDSLLEFAEGLDLLILDFGVGINSRVVDLLGNVDRIVVVSTSEPASLADSYAAVKTIHQSFADIDVSLMVNRADSYELAEKVAESIGSVLDKFTGRRMSDWAYVPEDSAVGLASKRRAVFAEAYAASPAAVALRKYSVQVMSMLAAPPGRKGSVCVV